MDSHPWLLAVAIFLGLILVSFILAMEWTRRLPSIFIEMGLRATDRWTSRPRTNVSFPVPNEDDEDYLETRSYA
jgi:hypothetical protein